MSRPACWVSQVAYRFPAASAEMSPSIHHSARDIVSREGPRRAGADQLFPPVQRGGEVTVRRGHRIRRLAGDVIALVFQVDPAARLDQERRAVTAAGGETR